ncbi:MAG: hypothetical protein GX863_05410, partial [Firmicutes bacterium]|nr:hypothetical protein [Candidatus Fermentithermobacillaceae bacterium]
VASERLEHDRAARAPFGRGPWELCYEPSYASMVGVGVGQSIYTSLRSQVINQAVAAMVKLPGATLGTTLNGLVSVLGLLTGLTYFIFTVAQNRLVKGVSQAGRWLIMVTFGVGFGNVVAGRISVLLGELQTIFGNWLGMF